MFKLLLILAIAVSSTIASLPKEDMLKTNRIVKAPAESATCQECESVIHKIVEASKDPSKMAELKMILGLLCKETSYAEECRLFVSQLDRFIDKLAPYLKDAHAICARLHLCSNKRIESFHRLLLDFERRVGKAVAGTPQIVCDECEFAVKEVKSVIENKEAQTQVRDFLRENVCKPLGSYRGFCDLIVDEYLPQFIQQLDAILTDPHQVCVDVHACSETAVDKKRTHVGVMGIFQKFIIRQ